MPIRPDPDQTTTVIINNIYVLGFWLICLQQIVKIRHLYRLPSLYARVKAGKEKEKH
jgi:hypothetical protein